MDDSIHEYMTVGVVHNMAYPQCMSGTGPVLETVTALAANPFWTGIEVTQVVDPAVRAAVAHRLREAAVTPFFAGQPLTMLPGLNLEDPDPAARAQAVQAVQAGIDQAVELGAASLTVMSGHYATPVPPGIDRLVDSLKQLCAYGQPRGVSINIETFDQVSYGKDCLAGPTGQAVRISEAVREEFPDFGLLLDLAHLYLLNEDPAEAVRIAGDHLVHVHLADVVMDDPDSPYYGDNHPYFGVAGGRVGVPQVAAYLQALVDTGWARPGNRRVVSVEVKPDTAVGDTSEGVVAGAERTVRAAWSLVRPRVPEIQRVPALQIAPAIPLLPRGARQRVSAHESAGA